MGNKKEEKKKNIFVSFFKVVAFLAIIFVATVWITKYYFYDSDFAVKKTDLSEVSIDGIKLGMNIDDIDISAYTPIEETVGKCNNNYEELSIKTNSNGIITYVIANYSDIKLEVGQEKYERIARMSGIWKELGSNYKTETYNPEENNYWKICRYVDTDNEIYMGIIYSRFNNEITKVILSNDRIKN